MGRERIDIGSVGFDVLSLVLFSQMIGNRLATFAAREDASKSDSFRVGKFNFCQKTAYTTVSLARKKRHHIWYF